MNPRSVRDRHRADDGGAAPRARCRRPTPTWSSCGSTRRSPGCGRRARGPAAARSSSPAAPVGRRPLRRLAKRSAADAARTRQRAGAEYVDVEAARRVRPDLITRAAAAAASSCRRTCSATRRRTCRARYARMRSTGAEVVEDRGRGADAHRHAAAVRSGVDDTDRRIDGHVLLRWGSRRAVADAGARLRQPLDLRRRRRRARADAGVAAARSEFRFRRIRSRRRALRRGRQPDRAFAVAGHAQRRVRRARA